jgi:hypothetical protein
LRTFLYDDDVYIKKITTRCVTKSNPTQKCRPAKGISKRVNIQIIKDTDIIEQPIVPLIIQGTDIIEHTLYIHNQILQTY